MIAFKRRNVEIISTIINIAFQTAPSKPRLLLKVEDISAAVQETTTPNGVIQSFFLRESSCLIKVNSNLSLVVIIKSDFVESITDLYASVSYDICPILLGFWFCFTLDYFGTVSLLFCKQAEKADRMKTYMPALFACDSY